MSEHDVFAVPAVPADRRCRAAEAGWPDGLIDRMAARRWPEWRQELYLSLRDVEQIQREMADLERLDWGLQVREATWDDDERMTDLFAHSTERLGDWDLTVERGPNPFAQMRLHENGHVKVVADRGVAVAASMSSVRSSFVGGHKLSVGWVGGWRVRDGMHRNGYGNLLLCAPEAALGTFAVIKYWYVRTENVNALGFVQHVVEDRMPEAIDKVTAVVHHHDAAAAARPDSRVRPVGPDDIGRCVKLVNRTHHGLDLFRPYSVEFLESRLHDGHWGPKPSFVAPVYGWPDLHVLEDKGEVVACGGLWDRGRDVRERWRHRTTGEEREVTSTCVLDLGFAEGRADAMAALMGDLAARTAALGRTTMVAALEFLPDVQAALAWAEPVVERRHLETMVFGEPGFEVPASVTRPYTDLVYW